MKKALRLSSQGSRRMIYHPSSSRRPRSAGRNIPPLVEYRSNPKALQGFTVPKVSPVPFGRKLPGGYALAIGRLGLRATGFNPVGLAANIAFEIANGIDFTEPWARQQPAREAGWALPPSIGNCCSVPLGPHNAIAILRGGNCQGATGRLCGTTLQVPDAVDGRLANLGDLTVPLGRRYMIATGPGRFITSISARYTVARIDQYPATQTQPNIHWRPAQAPRYWPLPRSRPNPAAVTEVYQPAPNPMRNAKPRPYQRPSVSVSTRPNGSTSIRNDLHNQLPPSRGEREKKEKMAAAAVGRWIYRLYDATTEASEIVDILYDNLGKKCKGAKGMSAKANCVYRNLSTLDIPNAIGELVQNHYEDKAWGKFYGYGKSSPFGAQLPGGTLPKPDFGNIKGPGIEQLSQIWR